MTLAPAAPPTLEALTPDESARRDTLEATVEGGLEGFVRVGSALAAIRDERLYRSTHGSFPEYLAERWGLQGRRAYQLMEAAAAVQDFSDPPTVESHARALAGLPQEHREAAYRALERLGKVTASTVRALADVPEENLEAFASLAGTDPQLLELVSQLVRETGNGKPTPSTVRSLAAIAHGITVTGALDTEDGEQREWLAMTPDERRAYLMANLDYETYERQAQHKAARKGTELAQVADDEVDRVTVPKAKYLELRLLAAYAPDRSRRAYEQAWGDTLPPRGPDDGSMPF